MKKSIVWRLIYSTMFITPQLILIVYSHFLAITYPLEIYILITLIVIMGIYPTIREVLFTRKAIKNKLFLIQSAKKINIIVEKKEREKRTLIYCYGTWINTNDNKKYKFRSIEYCSTKLKIPVKVDVYIDPENPKIYYMALEEAVKDLNKGKTSNKNKYKLKLPFNLTIDYINKINPSDRDITILIQNKIDFKVQKSAKKHLNIIFTNNKSFLVLTDKKEIYGCEVNDDYQVNKIVEYYCKNGRVEDLSLWKYDNIKDKINFIKEIEYYVEKIRVEGDYLIIKSQDEPIEQKIKISNITKAIKISDSQFLGDDNIIIFTENSRVSLATEEDMFLNMTQIYKEIIEKNKKLVDISIEVNYIDF